MPRLQGLSLSILLMSSTKFIRVLDVFAMSQKDTSTQTSSHLKKTIKTAEPASFPSLFCYLENSSFSPLQMPPLLKALPALVFNPRNNRFDDILRFNRLSLPLQFLDYCFFLSLISFLLVSKTTHQSLICKTATSPFPPPIPDPTQPIHNSIDDHSN